MKKWLGFLFLVLPISNIAYAQCDCDYKYRKQNACQGSYRTNKVPAPASAAKHDFLVRFTSNAPKGQCSIVHYSETVVVGGNKFDRPASITINGWRDSNRFSGLQYKNAPRISIRSCDVCVGRKGPSSHSKGSTNHIHGGRAHTHALPSQGVGHRHGNGAIGQTSRENVQHTIVNKQTPSGYMKDQNGCLHSNPNPQPNESITWTGKCLEGYASGQGNLKWYENGEARTSYSGNKVRGKRHGQGTQRDSDNSKYVGNYKDGKQHGQGTLTLANGDKYVGDWVNNKKHGQGTYIYSNGGKFIGNYVNGIIHGRGREEGKEGILEIGYENGKMHGKGKFYSKIDNEYYDITASHGEVIKKEYSSDSSSGLMDAINILGTAASIYNNSRRNKPVTSSSTYDASCAGRGLPKGCVISEKN